MCKQYFLFSCACTCVCASVPFLLFQLQFYCHCLLPFPFCQTRRGFFTSEFHLQHMHNFGDCFLNILMKNCYCRFSNMFFKLIIDDKELFNWLLIPGNDCYVWVPLSFIYRTIGHYIIAAWLFSFDVNRIHLLIMFSNYTFNGVQVMFVAWFTTCTITYSEGNLYVLL